MKHLLIFSFLAIHFLWAHAQCDYHLVERAAEAAGTDAVYIRDFKVKLSNGDSENPSPTAKYPLYLNKGINYRFSIARDTTQSEYVSMILNYKGNDMALINTENRKDGYFDFYCDQSATYELLIAFDKGEAGCAVGVMSMVISDSMKVIRPEEATIWDTSGNLYLFVTNHLNIAATGIPGGTIDITTNNGRIVKKSTGYDYTADNEGTAEFYIQTFTRKGMLNEQDTLIYKIILPPLPLISFQGFATGTVKSNRMTSSTVLELGNYTEDEASPYELIDFSVSSSSSGLNSIPSNGNHLSLAQLKMIQSLKPGEGFYLLAPRFKAPDGSFHLGQTSHFVVLE